MVLAAYGMDVDESVLRMSAHVEQEGTRIDEVERLTRQFGLCAEIQEPTVEQLGDLVADGKLPITYIDRAVFKLKPSARVGLSLRSARMHTSSQFASASPSSGTMTRYLRAQCASQYESSGSHTNVLGAIVSFAGSLEFA